MNRREIFTNAAKLAIGATALVIPTVAIAETSNFKVNDGVRHLINEVKRVMSEASRDTMFEYNDAYVRMAFRNWMEYCLYPAKSDGTIADYKIVCDESNNTAEVISNGQFVADIYIQPTKAVKFIHLNAFISSHAVQVENL